MRERDQMGRRSVELASWLERVGKLRVSWLEIVGKLHVKGVYEVCEREIVDYSVSFVVEPKGWAKGGFLLSLRSFALGL